jgi:hypothetical protein
MANQNRKSKRPPAEKKGRPGPKPKPSAERKHPPQRPGQTARFVAWSEKSKLTNEQIAALLDVTTWTVYKLRSGLVPGRRLALDISRVSKGDVPFAKWYEEEGIDELPDAARREAA